MRKLVCSIACAAVLAAAGACNGKKDNEAPAATPSVTLSKERVAIGSPVKLTYKFDVASNAAINKNYWVFVHVLDQDGEQLWTDDHIPPIPSSTWKAGQKVEYERTVFVPTYPYVGPATIRLGLYDHDGDGKRLTMNGTDKGRKEYEVASFQLLPQSENIFVIYKDGWHPAEMDPANPAAEWQWMKKSGTVQFRNPRKDATFYVEADARADLFNPPQQVTVKVNGQAVGSFAADSKDKKLYLTPISAAQFGTGDMVEITLEVDKTFTPKDGGDTRELGIRVFHVFVEPK
jgi:hypothetical protein